MILVARLTLKLIERKEKQTKQKKEVYFQNTFSFWILFSQLSPWSTGPLSSWTDGSRGNGPSASQGAPAAHGPL